MTCFYIFKHQSVFIDDRLASETCVQGIHYFIYQILLNIYYA